MVESTTPDQIKFISASVDIDDQGGDGSTLDSSEVDRIVAAATVNGVSREDRGSVDSDGIVATYSEVAIAITSNYNALSVGEVKNDRVVTETTCDC